MNPSNEERAALRKLLQARLNGKVTGFQDAHLNAMLKQGLSTEGRLAIASWSELSALLPRVLVHTLLAAYNSSALNGPGTPEKQPHGFKPGSYLYGRECVSNCFYVANLMIAANQTADTKEGSNYRGVSCCWRLPWKRWRAQIHWLGKAIHLGYFGTEEEAAQMYDRAAICVRGPKADLNFVRELYDHDQLSNGWVDSEAQLHLVLDKFKDNHRNSQRPTEGYVPLSSHVDAV